MELKVGFVCDRGLNPKRPVNQDRLLAIPERGLFAVFDGVGGQRAGEVASQTAAETIEETLKHAAADSSVELIRRAVGFANRDIFEMASGDPAFHSMATTVALVHIDRDRATVAHVGDSRVYRLEGGRLYKETIDHTDLDDALRAGSLTIEQAMSGNGGNVINRALGVEPGVDVEIKSLKISEGARFLLCSDGIYRHLSDEEIARILAENDNPQRAAEELKRMVYERGADDNLTAVVVQLGRARKTAAPSAETTAHHQNRRAGAATSRGSRIHVEFNPDGEAVRSSHGDDFELPSSHEQKSTSKRIIYTLVTLLLMALTFYGGLRASRWLGERTSAPADSLRVGRAAFDGRAFEAAAIEFGSLVKREPQNAEAHYWLGRALLEQGEFAKAGESLEQAIRLQPSMLDAYVQAAAAYEADGKKEEAAKVLRQYGEQRRKGKDKESDKR